MNELDVATPTWQIASMNQLIMLRKEKTLLLRSTAKPLKIMLSAKTSRYEIRSMSVMLGCLAQKKRGEERARLGLGF